MRRRRYLTAAALGLSGLAGCAGLDPGTAPTDTATEAPTETPTSTEQPTATPRQEPPAVEPPDIVELLPKQHLKGTEDTPNANFVRIDWDWYLSHYDTEMQFGVTSEEDWTLEANAGNLNERPPPQYRLLHTPVGKTIQTAGGIANFIPEYPNLGPELIRQCGMEMLNESGNADSRATYTGVDNAEIEDIVAYASPGISFFIGIDVDSLKNKLEDNDPESSNQFPDTTFYSGNGRMNARRFFVSEAWKRPVLCVETADEEYEAIRPAISRVTGIKSMESAANLKSVQWCLSEFKSSVPIVVGQINGGRAKFANSNYTLSPIRSLEGYDTVFNGLDIRDGGSASAQVVASNVDGEAPSEQELRDLYGPKDVEITTEYHQSVSNLTTSWGL